ncbi:helix-turn-helix domain-containing protein [Candidatus Aerophobetes bacterium]|nr:helix-turn-helix domain-containing protein [Candidatus Aerophobetes bacterium]
MIKINDTVEVVKQKRKSKKWKKYYGFNLVGKKGKVIQILGTQKEPYQGVKVRFPCIRINSGERKKPVYGFEWSFYLDEVKKIDDEIEFKQPSKRVTLKGKALESRKRAVQRLRQRGESIKDLAARYNVSKRTIWRWLRG